MRRLKSKYKWTNRRSHFLVLERHDKLSKLFRESIMYGTPVINGGSRTAISILGILKDHWTPEEVKELHDWKFRYPEFDELPSVRLADKSALEEVAGTTNPADTEFPHLSDELDDRYGAWGLVRRTKHHHFVMLDTSKD